MRTIEQEAKFLKKWSKKKTIVKQTDTPGGFWAAGSYMTKIDSAMAIALAEAGFADLHGNPHLTGARLIMK